MDLHPSIVSDARRGMDTLVSVPVSRLSKSVVAGEFGPVKSDGATTNFKASFSRFDTGESVAPADLAGMSKIRMFYYPEVALDLDDELEAGGAVWQVTGIHAGMPDEILSHAVLERRG